MAIYQKGDLKLDEAVVGTKSAADWASQGFTPVQQATAPTTPTTPTTKTATPQAPQGSVAINGAEFNTAEKQKQAFTNIQPIGNTLYGIPKAPIVPDVIPQKDFTSTMSPETLSTTVESAKSLVGFNEKQVSDLNKAYQRQVAGTASETDNKNIEYAKSKGWQPAEIEEQKVTPTTNVPEPTPTKSTSDLILELYSNIGDIRAEARAEAMKDTKLMEKGEAIATASTLVNRLRTDLQNQAIFDIKEQDVIRAKPILTSQIQGQLEGLSREQKLDAMILQNNYNNALVELQIAEGNYDRAREIVKETADDAFETANLQLDALMFKNQIEDKEYDRMRADLEYERQLGLEGYTHIKSPEGLKGLTEDKIFRDPVSGKIYLKPEPDVSQIINVGGRMKGLDSKGNIIRDFGSTASGLSISEQLALLNSGMTIGEDGTLTRDTSNATVDQIASAIKQIESNNNYEAKGASGEYGAYQFMPGTWEEWSSQYAQQVLQMSMILNPTPENQDAVAKWKISQWVSQGLSPEQIAAKWNSGSEIGWENKIGTNKQGVAYNVPAYVNKFKNALASQVGTGQVDAFTTLEATNLVKTVVGPRGVNNEELGNSVASLLASGKSKDEISDMIRYSEQSLDYGEWRSIANSVFSSVPGTKREAIEDGLDDFISNGDMTGAKDYILKVARDTALAEEKKNVTAREEALYAVNIIEDSLAQYINMGGDTGLLTGNVEKFYNRVLKKTKDPIQAELANTIAQTIQTYRQQLTGAAFTESEAREYNRLFPSITKSPELNQSLINSLKSQYERNMRLFYERQLGSTGYTKLEELTGEPIVGTGDLQRFTSNNNIDLAKSWLGQNGY